MQQASFDIREQAGHSLKSSLKHTMGAQFAIPAWSSAMNARVVNEVAGHGLGGSAHFLRNSLQASFTQFIAQGWSWSLNLWTGLLNPASWNNKRAPAVQALLEQCADSTIIVPFSPSITPSTSMNELTDSQQQQRLQHQAQSFIQDRFFLGGATDVRGFTYRGIGPRSRNDALGGDFFWGLGLHLNTPLPIRSWRDAAGTSASTHFFLTAGSIVKHGRGFDLRSMLADSTKSVAATAGVGLSFMTGGITLELNLVYPFSYANSDVRTQNVQFGVGMQYL